VSRIRTICGRAAVAAGVGLSVALGLGCTYEKVVYRRPMLAGLPGVVSGGALISDKPRGYRDPTQIDGGEISKERADGSKILLARSARHLMAHIHTTLKENQKDLFTEQVLCETTRAEFRANGMDAGEAFEHLKEREGEVAALFGRMPMGEYTPGVLMRKIDGDVYRVALSPKAAKGLSWCGFDMVWEGGRLEDEAGGQAPQVYVPTLEEALEETGSVAGATSRIAKARASQPKQVFIQSGWKLRWFVPTPPLE
jgi:hypothetical protein